MKLYTVGDTPVQVQQTASLGNLIHNLGPYSVYVDTDTNPSQDTSFPLIPGASLTMKKGINVFVLADGGTSQVVVSSEIESTTNVVISPQAKTLATLAIGSMPYESTLIQVSGYNSLQINYDPADSIITPAQNYFTTGNTSVIDKSTDSSPIPVYRILWYADDQTTILSTDTYNYSPLAPFSIICPVKGSYAKLLIVTKSTITLTNAVTKIVGSPTPVTSVMSSSALVNSLNLYNGISYVTNVYPLNTALSFVDQGGLITFTYSYACKYVANGTAYQSIMVPNRGSNMTLTFLGNSSGSQTFSAATIDSGTSIPPYALYTQHGSNVNTIGASTTFPTPQSQTFIEIQFSYNSSLITTTFSLAYS